jgi:hypothetical protein
MVYQLMTEIHVQMIGHLSPPQPVPLKWIGVDVQIRSMVIMQYGHPGGVKSSSNPALIGFTVEQTGHLNS